MQRVEQNEYDLSWETIGDKKTLIREFFEDGKPETDIFRLNYFSGVGTSLYPMTVAGGVQNVYSGTNPIVFEFSSGCLGVTMFDYIGEDAIAHIVDQQVRCDRETRTTM